MQFNPGNQSRGRKFPVGDLPLGPYIQAASQEPSNYHNFYTVLA